MTFFDLGSRNNFNDIGNWFWFERKEPLIKKIYALELENCVSDYERRKLISKHSFPRARICSDNDGNVIIQYPPEYKIMTNPFTKPWPELGKHRRKDGSYV